MRSLALIAVSFLTIFSGCGTAADTDVVPAIPPGIDANKFVLQEEPDGAIGVIEARETSEDGKPLVMVGCIGGIANPWIDGRAAFTLLDASMTVVAEGEEMTEGAICTGECCDDLRAGCTALVKFVDAKGSVIPVDSRQLFGVKESDMLVIEGTAQKDKSGNFVMIASRLFIRQ